MFLEALRRPIPEGFHFNFSYIYRNIETLYDAQRERLGSGLPSCGTVGCAYGLAIVIGLAEGDDRNDNTLANDELGRFAKFGVSSTVRRCRINL